jgi:AcrR family transcriptional regulator
MNAVASRRRRPRGETRRAQILDAATAVFLEHGYAGATIDLVVARAGASKATVYSFFGGKEGLFSALIDERAERILAGFPDVEVGKIDVPAALADIARRYMDVAMSPDAIGLYRLILAEGPRFPDLVNRFYRVGHDRVAAGVAQALRTWARRGRISADDPDRLATQFLDVVRGDLHLRVVAGVPPDDLARAIESNIDHGVRTFWRAVSPRGEERGHAD